MAWFNLDSQHPAGQAGGPFEMYWKSISGGGTYWYGSNGSGVVTATVKADGGLLMGVIIPVTGLNAAATLNDVLATQTKVFASGLAGANIHPCWIEFGAELTLTTGSNQFIGLLLGTSGRPPFSW